MAVQETILKTALNQFCQFGVKQMTMDDLAHACGISKRTLYSHFENKAQVVDAAVEKAVEHIKNDYEKNRIESKNAIEETIKLLNYFEDACSLINVRMLSDLQKYYYNSWIKVDAFKQEMWKGFILSNLKRGREEGLYSDEFDSSIIAQMRLQQLAFIHQIAQYNRSLHKTLVEITMHYLKGMASSKGLQLLKNTNTNTI